MRFLCTKRGLPGGLGSLEGPGVLRGLGPEAVGLRALGSLGPDGVGPVAHPGLGVEVKVAAALLLEAGPVGAVVEVPAVVRIRKVRHRRPPAVDDRVADPRQA